MALLRPFALEADVHHRFFTVSWKGCQIVRHFAGSCWSRLFIMQRDFILRQSLYVPCAKALRCTSVVSSALLQCDLELLYCAERYKVQSCQHDTFVMIYPSMITETGNIHQRSRNLSSQIIWDLDVWTRALLCNLHLHTVLRSDTVSSLSTLFLAIVHDHPSAVTFRRRRQGMDFQTVEFF